MAQKDLYESKTEQFVLPILEKKGFYLYDVEFVKEGGEYYLRVYIDKEGGITIDDCVDVSREMNEILDTEDYIPEAYTFEVSSPGLGRVLKKDKHLEMSIGEDVEIKTYKPIDGSKEFVGVLEKFDKDTITLVIDDNSVIFNRSDIARIRLSIDF